MNQVKQYHKHHNNHNNNSHHNHYNNNNNNHNYRFQQTNLNESEQVSLETKQQLLQYIYKTITLSNYKYKLLEFEYDLSLLKEKQYYVSPNYNGIHSLLVFIKIKDKFLSFIVDRKTLTYNLNQVDYDKVKVIPIYFRLEDSIYQGSIFDGVLLYNNVNGLKHFVINDIYCFRGKNITDDKITNKMLNISTFLEATKQDNTTNNIVFIINKLYSLKDIQQLVNMYIPKSKYNKSIKGIAFYPEVSGMKLIYLYNNCSHEKIDENNQTNESQEEKSTTSKTNGSINTTTANTNSTTIVNKKSSVTPSKIIKDPKIVITDKTNFVFKMKKTDTVDVYNLYLGQKEIDGDKKLFKYKKIDIAYVPTKECSYFCKDAFASKGASDILVECTFDNDKKKWIPTKLSNQKRPDLVDDIQDLMSDKKE